MKVNDVCVKSAMRLSSAMKADIPDRQLRANSGNGAKKSGFQKLLPAATVLAMTN
jgi:hypothetical protein